MYRWVEHTADLALELHGEDLPGLFAEGLRALAATWLPQVGALDALESLDGELTLHDATLEELMVNLLNESIFMATVRGEVLAPDAMAMGGLIEAVDGGWRLRVPSGPIRRRLPDGRPAGDHLKAATYHGLVVREEAGGWTATVVIDV